VAVVVVVVACFVKTAVSETASKPYYTGRHWATQYGKSSL